jgi:hypothetical protein
MKTQRTGDMKQGGHSSPCTRPLQTVRDWAESYSYRPSLTCPRPVSKNTIAALCVVRDAYRGERPVSVVGRSRVSRKGIRSL